MKKITLFSFAVSAAAFFFLQKVEAQNQNVGIGTLTPNASAMLDVVSTGKGLLIPRVSLTSTTDVTTILLPATSLLVYNTNAAMTGGGLGYWYWDGSVWKQAIGPQGPTGATGTAGATGVTGATGATGPTWTITSDNFNADGSLSIVTDIPSTITSTNAAWLCATTTAGTNASTGLRFLGTSTNQHMDLVSNNVVRGRLSNLGELFIGTTATAMAGDLMNSVGNATFPWAINGYTSFNGGATYGLRQAGASGNWGGGQFESTAGLPVGSRGVSGQVASTDQYGSYGDKPAGGLGWGGLFLNDLGYTGFFGLASDRKLKKNIIPLNNAMSIISQIPIYSYQYQTENYDILGDESMHYGVMADELKILLPALVKSKTLIAGESRSMPKDKQMRGVKGEVDLVNYIELIPIAIQAIKEQQKIIDGQNKKIDGLQKQIDALQGKSNR